MQTKRCISGGRYILKSLHHMQTQQLRSLTVATLHPASNETPRPFEEIPELRSNIFSLLHFVKNLSKTHEIAVERHKQYGPIVRSYAPILGHTVELTDLDAFEHLMRHEGKYPSRIELVPWIKTREEIGEKPGVFIAEGEDWHRMRRATNKVIMSTKHMQASVDGINDVIADFLEYLSKKRDEKNTIFALNDELDKWSLESVTNILYEMRLGSFTDHPDPDGAEFSRAVRTIFGTTVKLMLLPKWLAPWSFKKHKNALSTVVSMGRKCVAQKKKILQQPSLPENANENDRDTSGILYHMLAAFEEGGVTDKESISVITDLMGAGVETTSNGACFALYELSRNPDVQEKLYEEIMNVVPADQQPQAKHLQNTPYLRGVVKETLRMYPIAPGITRRLTTDSVIMGYRVPAGTLVSFSLYIPGRDEKLYPNAAKFCPDRWFRNEVKKQELHPFAFVPFGFGTRGCVGRRIAEMELHLLLAQLVRRFRIDPVSMEPVKIKTRMTLAPERPVDIYLKDR